MKVQIPKQIKTEIAVNDKFFDLRGLSLYSSLGISSLRFHIRENHLPCYSIRNAAGKVTKTLVKKSEFDRWMQHRWRDDLDAIANEAVKEIMATDDQ